LWAIRNLSFLDSSYKTFGKCALKVMEKLLPDIEKANIGDLGA